MQLHRERERRSSLCTSVLVMLVAMFFIACTGRGGDNAITPDTPQPDAGGIKGAGVTPGGGWGDPPGGPPMGGHGEPVGGLQSLADYSEGQINPRLDIIDTFQVQIGGGPPVTVNQLSSEDPFTGRYQLEDGTIVSTALPIEDVLQPGALGDPPVVEWTDGIKLFDGQIILSFIPTASQLAIEQFISANNLTAMFSLFYPNETGNDLAVFQFEYDTLQYVNFEAAYQYFSQQPLVLYTEPNSVNEFVLHYDNPNGPGYDLPNDEYHLNSESRFVRDLGIDFSEYVPYGPMSDDGGEGFSMQVVAVIDVGVWREHEDFSYV